MEFPNTGIQCSIRNCKQLDFLPFTCNHCQIIFCKEHFPTVSHSCSKFNDNIVDSTKITSTFQCSQNDCTSRSPIEMHCIKCKKHFCLLHRHHGCLEPTEIQKKIDLQKWEKPTHQFSVAKSIVDKEVTSKLNKSKNVFTAMKVQLIRLKGKSVGPTNIPINERCYFLVHLPKTSTVPLSNDSKGAFVSINWSIGKVIDSIANSLNIPNFNNQSNTKKLRIFNYFTGMIITNQMHISLNELLLKNSLINGQDIILEYFTSDVIDSSLYK